MPMKFAIYTNPYSQCYSTLSPSHDKAKIPKPLNQKPWLKPSILSYSLNTSYGLSHDFQEQENLELRHVNEQDATNFDLPIVVRHWGRVSRCIWDGEELKLVSVDGGYGFSLEEFWFNFEDGVRKLGRVCGDAARNFFLPREVSPNYLEYVKWKFLHRVFSSALQVLATQAMFRAIGIGYSRSLPSAAALNWVLKDGLGRLSRCIYTASLASAFDTNLKRVRFSTSALFSLSIGVEFLTPIFPRYFLLLATVANVAKQISLACHISTGSAVHRSFAMADKLGEVSAKSQIQTVCFDNIGLMLAATFNILFQNNQRLLEALPFVVYPIFSALDLYGIYQGLKHIHLQTLTKDRLEEIINNWTWQGSVPSPAEVSKREGIDFLWWKGGYSHLLREGAGTPEVIMGLLQACYICKILGQENSLVGFDSSDSVLRQWLALMEESRRSAQNNLDMLMDAMSGSGWACKNVLLTIQEQVRYSFVAD